jgi:hypothetical protein
MFVKRVLLLIFSFRKRFLCILNNCSVNNVITLSMFALSFSSTRRYMFEDNCPGLSTWKLVLVCAPYLLLLCSTSEFHGFLPRLLLYMALELFFIAQGPNGLLWGVLVFLMRSIVILNVCVWRWSLFLLQEVWRYPAVFWGYRSVSYLLKRKKRIYFERID